MKGANFLISLTVTALYREIWMSPTSQCPFKDIILSVSALLRTLCSSALSLSVANAEWNFHLASILHLHWIYIEFLRLIKNVINHLKFDGIKLLPVCCPAIILNPLQHQAHDRC